MKLSIDLKLKPINYIAIFSYIFLFNTDVINCFEAPTTSTQIAFETNLDELNQIRIKCAIHQNCSSKLFTLDSYCCKSSGYCCNWFEFASSFPTQTETTNLPYKAPTLLTIFTLLIMIVCILFISYCFSIIFCYCFKCGLFKKPNLIVITELPAPNHDSNSNSAEIISPKHSSSSSSASSVSFSSSTESPYNQYRHRSKHANKSSSHLNKQKPKKLRHNQSYPSNLQSNNNNNNRRNVRSPTARATSNRLYAKPECYVDYDNESPFLIPQQIAQKSQPKPSNRRANQYRSASYRNSVDLVNQGHQRPLSTHSTNPLVENNQNQFEIVEQTPLASGSSSSLDFRASLMEVVEVETGGNGISLVHQISACATLPTAPSYYLDEKPPSYDDIIGGGRR